MAEPGEFLAFNEAVKEFSVSVHTLRDRIRTGELAVWSDPLDRRRRLLRRSDLDSYAAPRRADGRRPSDPVRAA